MLSPSHLMGDPFELDLRFVGPAGHPVLTRDLGHVAGIGLGEHGHVIVGGAAFPDRFDQPAPLEGHEGGLEPGTAPGVLAHPEVHRHPGRVDRSGGGIGRLVRDGTGQTRDDEPFPTGGPVLRGEAVQKGPHLGSRIGKGHIVHTHVVGGADRDQVPELHEPPHLGRGLQVGEVVGPRLVVLPVQRSTRAA